MTKTKYRVSLVSSMWTAKKPGRPTGYGSSPKTAFKDAENRFKKQCDSVSQRLSVYKTQEATIARLEAEISDLSLALDTSTDSIPKLRREIARLSKQNASLAAEVKAKRAFTSQQDMYEAWLMISMAYFKEADPTVAIKILFDKHGLYGGLSNDEIDAVIRVNEKMKLWRERMEGRKPLDFHAVFKETLREQAAIVEAAQ